MNKKDFYKQLMSEYTFDADKIRENAKKGKRARQKLQPIYIGMTAAAAVCVVTVGTIAAVNLTRPGGVSLVNSGDTQLSASDRLSNALEQLEKERGSSESKDFLVTFSSAMSPAQAQSVLTGYSDGSIPVKQLYFADGTQISDVAEIEKVFTSGGSYQITGAAVYCSGSTAAEMQNDPAVFLVEADFDGAAPVNIDDIKTTEVTLPDTPVVTEPVDVPQQPINPGAVTNEDTGEAQPFTEGATSESDGTAEVVSSTEEMDGTSEPAPVTEQADPGEPATAEVQPGTSEADTPDSTAPVTSQTPTVTEPPSVPGTAGTGEPTVPVENPQPQTLPEGVTLPENVDGLNYYSYIAADSAFFLNDDTFFVKSDSDVALYRFENGEETLLCSEELPDAKLIWAAENGGKLMVSGMSDYGTRGRILLVDADNETITDLHAEDAVMSGIISSASYNADSGLLVLNVRENGSYYICVSSISEYGENSFIGIPYESSNKLVVAASKGNTIYLAENEGGTMRLLAVDAVSGDVRTIHTFSGIPEISRNLAFTHAVFTPDASSAIGFTEIFDPETEKLIPLYGSDSSAVFGASRHSFINGDSCRTISGGAITESGGISKLAAIEYRKSFSAKYSAHVSGGTVRITDSIYSSANKNGLLTFSEISGNASEELRQAMNGAVGVNNALALGACAESGITKPQTLIDCIDLYYSPSAAQKIIKRCGISPMGALRYESGGLAAVSAGDTELVISSQSEKAASGVLYIRAGSFGGRTAYRSVNVSFMFENGSWKLDTVL